MTLQPHSEPSSANQSSCCVPRDQFELLSAYLDGEVTLAERRQVEHWLASDPCMQRLHGRLLQLRQELQGLPQIDRTPSTQQNEQTQQVLQRVCQRLNRQRHLRWLGIGSISALVLGGWLVDGGVDRSRFIPQVATSPPITEPVAAPPELANTVQSEETPMIALNRPVVSIPQGSLHSYAAAPLMIMLDRPVVEIPTRRESSPARSVTPTNENPRTIP